MCSFESKILSQLKQMKLTARKLLKVKQKMSRLMKMTNIYLLLKDNAMIAGTTVTQEKLRLGRMLMEAMMPVKGRKIRKKMTPETVTVKMKKVRKGKPKLCSNVTKISSAFSRIRTT